MIDLMDLLTRRELAALEAYRDVWSFDGVGERLGISPATAKLHLLHVRAKLGTLDARCRSCGGFYAIGALSSHVLTPEHFWGQVDRSGAGCWEWQGSRYPSGYGHFLGREYAHRRAFELANGPVPAGRLVCHHCDNKPCCRPDHLYAGTPADNRRDFALRGRPYRRRAV
jgi:hypothetical protein